jgi:hypothetical protein
MRGYHIPYVHTFLMIQVVYITGDVGVCILHHVSHVVYYGMHPYPSHYGRSGMVPLMSTFGTLDIIR